MPMNPVLEYAIAHRSTARAMLFSRGILQADVDDVYQYALMRVLAANPRNRKGPAAYWYKTLYTAIADHWRRHNRQPLPFSHGCDGELARDREDSRQNIDHQADVLEALRQAGDICRAATPKERGAMTALVQGEQLDNAQRQRLFHLRRRLRAAVASPL